MSEREREGLCVHVRGCICVLYVSACVFVRMCELALAHVCLCLLFSTCTHVYVCVSVRWRLLMCVNACVCKSVCACVYV